MFNLIREAWKHLKKQVKTTRLAACQRPWVVPCVVLALASVAVLAAAIGAELEEARGDIERLCLQPDEAIAQCTEVLLKPPTTRPDTPKPPGPVFFGFAQAELRGDNQELRDLALTVKSAERALGLLVTGFTDPIGTVSYNLGLGCRRALAVKAVLAAAGLRQELISVRSLGKDPTYQVVPGKGGSAKGAQLNRRVTIQLVPFGPGVDHEDDCVPYPTRLSHRDGRP